ncbi:MAG: GWxTD domain-containing protein [Flavobacteriales bacterium]|nr:GWxTD domain-containing protein [Flavobacteriales bacterium]
MKKNLLAALLVMTATACVAQLSDIRAELGLARFVAPSESAYIETYLLLKGNSLATVEGGAGRTYSEVAIIMKVSKGSTVVFEDAYRVKGPLLEQGQMADFIDQQRIPLKDGHYELDITIHDVNRREAQPARVIQEVTIVSKGRAVQLSDIQLVNTYTKATVPNMLTKAGFDLVPYTSSFFPRTKEELTFYFEVYNTDKKVGTDGELLVNILVENADDGSLAGNLRQYFKRAGTPVIPVLHSFPIKHLPSGNYNIVVEVRDKKNELLDGGKFFFQRSNPVEVAHAVEDSMDNSGILDLSATFVASYNRVEELKHHVRCLIPIATQKEISQINRRVNYNDAEMMKRYLYNFWIRRYPDNAATEWEKYLGQVNKVNASYSNNLTIGYETDRGRVYLQYGPPDAMSPSYFEPNTYPYEIWHYYRLENRMLNAPQNNRRFVFANMTGAGEFQLLHSDADNELYNARWHFDLQKRNEPNSDLDEERGRTHHGSRALQYYNNPR